MNKRGELEWSEDEITARPGRLLRVEALLRALVEEFHRQDDTDIDPEFSVRLLLRQAVDWHRRQVNAQQRVRFYLLKLAKTRRMFKQKWGELPSFDPAAYRAALPQRFAGCPPLEVAKRVARGSAISEGKSDAVARQAHIDCTEVPGGDDTVTFEDWGQAIIEYDEE